MTVAKSNDKKSLNRSALNRSDLKKNVHGKLEGKTLQAPLNDQPEYQNVDSDTVRVPVPEDNSVPTWRCKNGAILPMLKFKNKESGEFEYKPRKKRGPAKGKKYAPRAGKITKMLQQGQVVPEMTEQVSEMPEMMPPTDVTTDIFGDLSAVMSEVDTVDFQALVHAWQMRSLGALNDTEFNLIKKSIFEKRETARAALITPAMPEQPIMQGTESTDMTF